MAGRRVFISGVGGELGTAVARMLEDEPWVGSLAGIATEPPRRRLQRTEFHRIQPSEHDRTVDTITAFNPHLLIHVGVWEPDSRATPKLAASLTEQSAISVLGAAAECRGLENIIVRSGIEIYGRAPGSLTRPAEDAPLRPTSEWGRTVADIENTARSVATRVGVSVGAVRLAPVLGPHVPSPLGRLLRQPAVPFHASTNPAFAVVEVGDASRAIVAAARERLDEPVNVVASGAVTCLHALGQGRRVPIPLFGPQWGVARRLSHLMGAPIPDHVNELLCRGRLAHNGRMRELLGITANSTTNEVIDQLYRWPSIVRRPARQPAPGMQPAPVQATHMETA